MLITSEVALKVLSIVDAGLVRGVGEPVAGKMCVEAAVCYALGLPHGDDPQCVSRALRALKIRLNDSNWSSDAARAKGLRRLAVAQLGSRETLDDREFVRRVVKLATQLSVPVALRAAASIHKNPIYVKALRDAANVCERDGARQSALDARDVAQGARRDADASFDASSYAVAAAAYAAVAAAAAASVASASASASVAASASAAVVTEGRLARYAGLVRIEREETSP